MKFENLAEALLSAPPQKTFVVEWKSEDDIRSVTFGEFISLASSYAAQWRGLGLRPGDRVILMFPQGISLMAAFAGIMLVGGVPAILAYPNFKADPAKYRSGLIGVSKNLNARLVIIDDAFPSELQDCIAVGDGTTLVRAGAEPVSAGPTFVPDISYKPGDLAFIQHSAGTTGLQKGVALSHSAVLTQLNHLSNVLKITDEDRIYSWLPLYHDMGLIACFMLPLALHLPIVMQAPTDWVMQPGAMLQLISEYRCTLSWIPNFALQFLSRRVRPDDREGLDLSSLRALINCSEPVRTESMDEFRTAYEPYGFRPGALASSYAMAENVFAVTQSEIDKGPRRIWVDRQRLRQTNLAVVAEAAVEGSLCFASSGRCLPGNEVQIMSSENKVLPDGAVGEILIRSDSLFDGYYNRADLTAKVLLDGWYWSGDLGFSLDGELYVIGRKKDLIIVEGKNIYSEDIEQIVCSHPEIHDGRALAFPLYNAERGTEDIIVVAELENEENMSGAPEIERTIRTAILRQLDVVPRGIFLKPPRWIVKSTAGKPARSTTREKFLSEHPEFVGG